MREHAEAASHAIQEGILEAGITTRNWYLEFSQACHTMSSVLGLKRLQELIQGTCSLSEEPLWLLGLWYGLHDTDTGTDSLPAEVRSFGLCALGNHALWHCKLMWKGRTVGIINMSYPKHLKVLHLLSFWHDVYEHLHRCCLRPQLFAANIACSIAWRVKCQVLCS
jgi:hypothetical protein